MGKSVSTSISESWAGGVGFGFGSSLGNAGGFTCNAQNQNTTYCQFLQYFNEFKMLLFLIFVLFIVYLLFSWWWNSGTWPKSRFGKR